ncbi:MAG: hypothetical protein WCK97_05725 [Actinomycetes bacterium]|jgi:hypothetical protein
MIGSQIGQLAAMFVALVLGTLFALLFGATNLATALTFGEMAFAATLVWILLRAPVKDSR